MSKDRKAAIWLVVGGFVGAPVAGRLFGFYIALVGMPAEVATLIGMMFGMAGTMGCLAAASTLWINNR